MKANTLTTPAPVWFDRADIPNTHAFRFVGLMHGNTEELCTVSRRADGSHTLANDAFPRLLKWRRLAAGDTVRPILQARFPLGGNREHLSFALLNENGEARAVIDCEGGTITRALMGQRTKEPEASAFRGFVLSVLSGATVRPAMLELAKGGVK